MVGDPEFGVLANQVRAPVIAILCKVTPRIRRPQASDGVRPAGIKQRGRSCRRWQLLICGWFYEVSRTSACTSGFATHVEAKSPPVRRIGQSIALRVPWQLGVDGSGRKVRVGRRERSRRSSRVGLRRSMLRGLRILSPQKVPPKKRLRVLSPITFSKMLLGFNGPDNEDTVPGASPRLRPGERAGRTGGAGFQPASRAGGSMPPARELRRRSRALAHAALDGRLCMRPRAGPEAVDAALSRVGGESAEGPAIPLSRAAARQLRLCRGLRVESWQQATASRRGNLWMAQVCLPFLAREISVLSPNNGLGNQCTVPAKQVYGRQKRAAAELGPVRWMWALDWMGGFWWPLAGPCSDDGLIAMGDAA